MNFNKIDRLNSNSLSSLSEYVFLNLLQGGPLSRAAISKLSGISRPTISVVADRLLQMGLIKQTEKKKENRRGRSGLLYDFNPDYGIFAICNIEKDKFIVKLLDFSLNLIAENIFQLPKLTTLQSLSNCIVECMDFSLNDKRSSIISLAIVIDRPSMLKIKPDNVLRLGDKLVKLADLESYLEHTFACRVLIDKKANWLAMSEKKLGAGKAIDNFVFVIIDEAIEIVSYINGCVVKGVNSITGDFTDLVLKNDHSFSKIQQHNASLTNSSDTVRSNILSVLSIVSVLLSPNIFVIFGGDASLISSLRNELSKCGVPQSNVVESFLDKPLIEKAINSILFDLTIESICNDLIRKKNDLLLLRD